MVLEIVIQVINADGAIIGTSLNVAVLALLDVGISMKSFPIATTCLVSSNTTAAIEVKMLFNPAADEEAEDEISIIGYCYHSNTRNTNRRKKTMESLQRSL